MRKRPQVVAGPFAAAGTGTESVVFRRDQTFLQYWWTTVSRGVDQPSLFTSRSEYRLLLRQDNALRRLMPVAAGRGLLRDAELRAAEARLTREEQVLDQGVQVTIGAEAANDVLSRFGSSPVNSPTRIAELARRPGVPLRLLLETAGASVESEDCEWADIELKYAGYLERERSAAARLRTMEELALPAGLEYRSLPDPVLRGQEKLHAQPASLGQAGRIPGVSPVTFRASSSK
jgi:tRNA uridine 5-carboxymethylaminomethyl modification enzyme